MTRLLTFFLILAVSLTAKELHLTLDRTAENDTCGYIKTARVEPGVSGFVVHHFTPEHSAIVANAVAAAYDDEKGELRVDFSPYTGLRQNSLPKGEWKPGKGDEVILAFAYNRGLLLSPTRKIYRDLTSRLRNIDWIHPDTFATYLSYRGHPTPLKKDIRDFCTVATTGLFYLYLEDSLFMLDCQSLALLQIAKADMPYTDAKVPFYSRVEEIHANWFGVGSGELKSYGPYYFELMVENNPRSRKLYDYIQSHPSIDRALLKKFDLKKEEP